MGMKIINKDEAEKELGLLIRKIFDDGGFFINDRFYDKVSVSLRYNIMNGKISFDRVCSSFARSHARKVKETFILRDFTYGEVLEADPNTIAKDLLDKFERSHYYALDLGYSGIYHNDKTGHIEAFNTYEQAENYRKELVEYSWVTVISRRSNMRVHLAPYSAD